MNQLQEKLETLKLKEALPKKSLKHTIKISQYSGRLHTLQSKKETLLRSIRSLFKRVIHAFRASFFTLTKPIAPVPKPQSKPTKKKKPTYTQNLTTIPTLEEFKEIRQFQEKPKHLIVWDMENISTKFMDRVLEYIDHQGHIILVSVEPLGKKVTAFLFPYILRYGIEVRTGHEDSDQEIIDILRAQYKAYKKLTVISSDTDFIPMIKKMLEAKKHVMVISRDTQKKSMLMRLKIDHERLEVRSL